MNVQSLPLISVVLPVYNGEPYLHLAVESILNQTYGNFELIAIDDGSQDQSWEILSRYALDDQRIRLIRNPHNLGIIATLNIGLQAARGKYIARMDADDISAPQRFEKQAAFLEDHPEVGILGTGFQTIDEQGWPKNKIRLHTTDLGIRWTSLLSCPFCHPAVMFRRELFQANDLYYRQEQIAIEDYDLWVRALQYTQGRNLEDVLLYYREHPDKISSRRRDVQLENHYRRAFTTIQFTLPDLAINASQVESLVGLFSGGDEQVRNLAGRRVELGMMFLDLLDVFIQPMNRLDESENLIHHEAVRVALVALTPPILPGWGDLAIRLLRLDPLLLFRYGLAYLNGGIEKWAYILTKKLYAGRPYPGLGVK